MPISYMKRYKEEIDRIYANIDKDHAWNYAVDLYNRGLICLPEWNELNEYVKSKEKEHQSYLKGIPDPRD